MGSVPTSLGEWIHSPWFDLGLVVWKGYRPRVRLVLAGGHASAWISPFWRGPAPGAQRYQAARSPHPTWVTAIKQIFRCYHPQAKCLYLKSTFPHLATLTDSGSREVHIYGFSAGSFTGLALREILTEYSAFPGITKVAAIAAPPELMNLATGDREVTLIHCIEDKVCVWRPYSLMELSYQVVLIERHPAWSGRAKHSYGHLLSLDIASGVHDVQMLQIAHPEVMASDVKTYSGSSPGLALTYQCT